MSVDRDPHRPAGWRLRPLERSRARLVGLSLIVASAACTGTGKPASGLTESEPLVVTRGALEQHLSLTGEIDAAESIQLTVPRTDDWNVAIRWMIEDGAHVQAGERVVELDNVAVVDRIRESERAVVEAAVALTEQQAKAAVAAADKRFEVRTATAALAKARLDTEIPEELLSRHEARTFAVALSRAEVSLANARADLEATVEGGKRELEVQRIALAKAERALTAAEAQLTGLELTAPSAGIAIIGEHPWEGRKLQVGDNVWPGMTVAKLPDLTKLVVEAWLSDVDDGRVQPGMAVSCIVDAVPDRPMQGHVVEVAPVAQPGRAQRDQPSTRRFFSVRIVLDERGPEILRPGLSVRIDVVTQAVEDALLAPRAALNLAADGATAHLHDGRAVDLVVDFCSATTCAVSSGLSEGDALRIAKEPA